MTETVDIRAKTRRVKDHILTRYLALADKVDSGESLTGSEKQLYTELTNTFARNVLPRSQEIGGDPDNKTPIPILMNPSVHPHISDNQNSEPESADKGDTGRDSSKQDNLDTSVTDERGAERQEAHPNLSS